MKNIIAFAGSNSKSSINKQLVVYAASLLEDTNAEILDLNNFELPIYSIDLERELGYPENAKEFLSKIKESDGIIISLAEHNGAYTAVFKNLLDWLSRIEGKTFYGKPMLLMATSNGARGGRSVLDIASSRFPRHDAVLVAEFSLPGFQNNFSNGQIINEELNGQLKDAVKTLEKAL